jgi:hypothetical protein
VYSRTSRRANLLEAALVEEQVYALPYRQPAFLVLAGDGGVTAVSQCQLTPPAYFLGFSAPTHARLTIIEESENIIRLFLQRCLVMRLFAAGVKRSGRLQVTRAYR